MPGRGERILAGELVTTSVLVTARELKNGQSPKPRQFFSTLLIFAILSGVSLVSDDFGDVAAGLGGLVLLSALMSFPDVFTWLARQSQTGFQDNGPPAKHPASAAAQNTSGLLQLLTGGALSDLRAGLGSLGAGPTVPVPTASMPGGSP